MYTVMNGGVRTKGTELPVEDMGSDHLYKLQKIPRNPVIPKENLMLLN